MAPSKLRQLEFAGHLEDLHCSLGHRLEALRGDRTGQHSIRFNEQFRFWFTWTVGGPDAVKNVDDH